MWLNIGLFVTGMVCGVFLTAIVACADDDERLNEEWRKGYLEGAKRAREKLARIMEGKQWTLKD